MKVMNIDTKQYKSYLKTYLEQYHNIHNFKKHFHCLNPDHRDSTPSMYFYAKANKCKCFGCGALYDIYDLIGIDYNISSFHHQIKKFQELFDIYDNQKIIVNPIKVVDDKIIDYQKYFNQCHININKSDYLIKRAIPSFLYDKYNIGFDSKYNSIIFPINKNSYFARSTISNAKYKSRGKSYLWNEELINNKNKLIYVCESIIDSLSLETIDHSIKTVSLNGLTNYTRLLEVCKEKKYKGLLVLSFDNDESGLYFQKIVKKQLSELGINSFSTTLISNIENCKDLNGALMVDKDKFEKNVLYYDKAFKNYIEKNNLTL